MLLDKFHCIIAKINLENSKANQLNYYEIVIM
jgi:hypothetical protein